MKPVFLGKNIMEPAIKHGQSEKRHHYTATCRASLMSITVPYIKRKASKTSASGGKIYKLGLRIAYLTTSTS